VDDDDNPLWDEYSIGAVPTVILFEEGKVCKKLDGRYGYGLSEKQLEEWLKET
jgi:thioredoxin-like negative regulator of GroEL